MNCCHPERDGRSADSGGGPGFAASGITGVHRLETVALPGGTFAMGDHFGEGYPADGELPVHEVRVGGFDIDVTAVTNEAFARFVAVTGHVTDAQRFGSSAVFHLLVAPGVAGTPTAATPWWVEVPGARWDAPYGPGSGVDGLGDHPVVHVSMRDAAAYCEWSGRALPSEAQWEYAARGGLAGARFPWGDAAPDEGEPRCNIFLGEFPDRPSAPVGTRPVRSYPPNGFGLYQAVGNVWEWCDDHYSARTYRNSAEYEPRGPDRGRARVLRGGSYLCHDSYCRRYRVAARSHNTPSSSAGNIGFRTVGRIES